MLIKYYGLVSENGKELSPRDEFLTNGLFRVTQPKFLNDKGSEGRLYPYFNDFSPADYEWARKEERKTQTNFKYRSSNNELEDFYLKPFTQRYGDSLPHLVKYQTGHESMAEYDKEVFVKSVEHINHTITELLSCTIGVFSLSKTDTNEHMWTHYASEGKGIALEFDDQDDFFNINKPKNVSYNELDRAFISYYIRNDKD